VARTPPTQQNGGPYTNPFKFRKMGIQGLTKLLSDETPGAIKEQELKNLTGKICPIRNGPQNFFSH
jgi:hypothetical protein